MYIDYLKQEDKVTHNAIIDRDGIAKVNRLKNMYKEKIKQMEQKLKKLEEET